MFIAGLLLPQHLEHAVHAGNRVPGQVRQVPRDRRPRGQRSQQQAEERRL